MKIGIVCHSSCGGSGVFATGLGVALAEKGHEIHFISSGFPHRADVKSNQNISFHLVDNYRSSVIGETGYPLALAAKIVEVVREHGIDLLNIHYAVPHGLSALIARNILKELKLPIVANLHGTDVTHFGKLKEFREATSLILRQFERLVSVSDFLASEIVRNYGIECKLETIYNFVDTDRFKPRDQKTHSRTHNFIHISNFRKIKNPTHAIQAFKIIANSVPHARLTLVGDGPLLPECQELVEKLNIAHKVMFRGKVKNVVLDLQESDISLLPSESESFGLVALEAMACSVPSIAYDVGGIPEVIKHGESGILVKKNDIQAMAEEGICLANQPERRFELGKSARSRALMCFKKSKIVHQYEECFSRVIESYQDSNEVVRGTQS